MSRDREKDRKYRKYDSRNMARKQQQEFLFSRHITAVVFSRVAELLFFWVVRYWAAEMSRDREKDRKYDSRNMARKQQQEFQAEERSIRASVSVSDKKVLFVLFFSCTVFFFSRGARRKIEGARCSVRVHQMTSIGRAMQRARVSNDLN